MIAVIVVVAVVAIFGSESSTILSYSLSPSLSLLPVDRLQASPPRMGEGIGERKKCEREFQGRGK